mgnify:CR=1 FL=1|tara:strand:- start:119 stop:493 length:375 start_codon:yes stop_codon:yes gene_type:complete
MPFVRRDAEGRIVAVFHQKVEGGLEEVDPESQELSDFLTSAHLNEGVNQDFIASDLGLARVLEDLIDLLIEKGVFRFTDLPEAAQSKLLARRGLRKEFAYVEALFSPDEDVIAADNEADEEGFL